MPHICTNIDGIDNCLTASICLYIWLENRFISHIASYRTDSLVFLNAFQGRVFISVSCTYLFVFERFLVWFKWWSLLWFDHPSDCVFAGVLFLLLACGFGRCWRSIVDVLPSWWFVCLLLRWLNDLQLTFELSDWQFWWVSLCQIHEVLLHAVLVRNHSLLLEVKWLSLIHILEASLSQLLHELNF